MSPRTSTAERLPVSEPPPLPPEALVEEKEVSYEDLQHEADAYLQSLVDLENARTLNPREAGAFAPLRAEAQVALQEAKGELEGSNDDAALIAAQLTGEELEEEIAHVALNLEAVQQHIRELGAHGRSFEDREVQQLMEEETRLEALAARLTAASEAQRFLEEKFAAMRAEAEALPLHLFDERIQGAVDALESLKRTGDERSEVELLQREIAILELARDRKQREETVAAIEAKLISDDEYRAELNSPERLRAHAEKIHDRDKARVAYAEAARVFERASGKERHTATDRLATAKAEYEALNTEAVGESVKRALYERAALLDARIEEKRQEKKIGTKIYEAWKWMGEQNLEKLGWKPEGKVGKWVAKMGSLRTAVSTGLVGGSIVLGAGTAVGVGAIMLRRAFAGMGAAFGTYDLLRMADKRTAEVKGLLKVPSDEELAALSLDDLTERLNAVEARALMDGETVSHGSYREVYATLQGAYIQKAETIKERAQAEKRGSEIAAFLKERSDALEQGLDRAAKRLKSTRTRQKIVAGAVGAVVGSGLIAKGFTGLKEWLSGAESEVAPAPSAAQIETIPREAVAVIDSTTGERVGFSKEGIEYAPPPEGTPASAEAEIPAVRAALEESLYVAKKGDSVWKIATRALEERYGAEFQSLDYAQKVHLIDGIKDQILKNPDSVGLQTPHVRPGDVINFTRLFEDQKAAADLFESSKELTPAQTDAIIKGGSPTQEWWIKKFERSWPSSDWEWPKGKLVAELNSTLAEAHEGSGGATHPDTSGFESAEADTAAVPEAPLPTSFETATGTHVEVAAGAYDTMARNGVHLDIKNGVVTSDWDRGVHIRFESGANMRIVGEGGDTIKLIQEAGSETHTVTITDGRIVGSQGGVEEELVYTGAQAEGVAGEAGERSAVGPGTVEFKNVKAEFKFIDGKVHQVSISGYATLEQVRDARALLKGGWHVELGKHVLPQQFSLVRSDLEARVRVIALYKDILGELKTRGFGAGPEARFLESAIARQITNTENQFGDVFVE